MSAEDCATSVYQLPKFQLIAAPRRVHSSPSQTKDSRCKSSASQPVDSVQFEQRSQPQNTVTSTLHNMLQTQECSRKFSSALSTSQTSRHIAVQSHTSLALTNGGQHIWPARSHAAEDRKIKSFLSSTSDNKPTPSHGTSSCHVNKHQETVIRRQKSEKSFVAPCLMGTVVEQPKKNRDRPTGCPSLESSSHCASLRSKSAWKSEVDNSSHKNRSTSCNVASASCNDSAFKEPSYVYTSHGNINNNNCLECQSDFARQHMIDRASYCVSGQRQVIEPGNSVSLPVCADGSKRCISVSLLTQNGRVKGSQFTVTTSERDLISNHVAPGYVAAADIASNGRVNDTGRILQSMETPGLLQTSLQPDSFAVVASKQSEDDVVANSFAQDLVSLLNKEPVDIKIEKRLISNIPMTICTLPVPRPAFVCKSLVPESATSTKSRAGLNSPGSMPRSYHETTRLQRHDQSGDRCRYTTISRLSAMGTN